MNALSRLRFSFLLNDKFTAEIYDEIGKFWTFDYLHLPFKNIKTILIIRFTYTRTISNSVYWKIFMSFPLNFLLIFWNFPQYFLQNFGIAIFLWYFVFIWINDIIAKYKILSTLIKRHLAVRNWISDVSERLALFEGDQEMRLADSCQE